jgi:hypothetical protein
LKRWGLAKPAFLADVPYERLLNDTSATHAQSISLG